MDELTEKTPSATGAEILSKIRFKDNTYEITSRVAYLIGVSKWFFEKGDSLLKPVYTVLDRDKNARIIRNLCMLRTAILRNYKYISDQMRNNYKTILNIPESIPPEVLNQLTDDGIHFYKSANKQLYQHISEINGILSNRINNCKNLFPTWLNWNYVKALFLMPEGLTEEGVKKSLFLYSHNSKQYPYQMYINWEPGEYGNILHNDKKFVTLLYRWNGDLFYEDNKVTDAAEYVKNNIHTFLRDSRRAVMMVDCENSDPYNLCAVLRSLKRELEGILQKIILVDDVNTVGAWQILESYTKLPVEHIMTERIHKSKSLVDIELTARTCMEHYQNQMDSFILVSSDSDYWGLISSLPNARFLVMLEREKCGSDIKDALKNNGIFYCFIEDFYAGLGDDIRRITLLNDIQWRLKEALQLNVNTMFEAALLTTRIEMSQVAKQQFFDKYIRQLKLNIDKDGNVSIVLNR